MTKSNLLARLTWITPVLGVFAFVLRWGLYVLALDAKGLLRSGHPLALLLWLLTAAALGLIAFTAWSAKGSNLYRENFFPSIPSAAGHLLAALGFGLTALLNEPRMDSGLGLAWKVLGLLSAPCLILAGLCRLQGRRPFFLLHTVPCLFLVLHIINHYQVWSGDPQLQDYVFALLGAMTLALFAFYAAAFDVGSGKRRMQLGMGFSAVYLCMAELACTEYVWLYLGGIAWALTDLCTLTPAGKFQRKTRDSIEDEP